MEKDRHDRIIHALPLRNEEKSVHSGRKAWLAPVLIAALVVLLAGGGILIHFLSVSSPVQETPAPLTLFQNDREGGHDSPAAPHGEEEISLRKTQEQGGEEEALRLDPGSQEAQSTAERVRKNLAEDEFQRHMSAGLTAYHKGDYALAKAEFQKADAFRPGTPEAKEALALADGATKLKDLETLKQKAAAAEEAEEWEKALDLYLAALRIEGALQFALQGKERALERMTLKKRLSFYLEKPDVLDSDDYLEKAIKLVDQAQNVEPSGPRHRQEVQRLQQLVLEAQTQIPVRLISDTLTEVSVFKVGELGTFTERELLLRPGKYTVVGARNGYRDVRKEIVVKAGDRDHRITVICREMI